MHGTRTLQLAAIDDTHAPARERALRAVRRAVAASTENASVAEPVIPVDADGWEAVLADAGVANKAHQLIAWLTRARTLNVNDPSIIGGELRRALVHASEVLDRLQRSVEQAAWFVPPTGRDSDRHLMERIAGRASEALACFIDALTSAGTAACAEQWRMSADELASLADELADRGVVDAADDDAVALVFGAPAERFTDRRGVIDSARIRAFYADRPEALEAISRRLLSSLIGDVGVSPPDAAVYAASFTLSERPLICHEVARETLAEISRRFAADPEATGEALARRFEGIKNSASTHFDGMAPTATRIEQTQSDGERARLKLELYRLAAEGPLRQTGWSYLELRGHAPRRTPSLAEVRDMLMADGSPLAVLIAGGIHVEWRNPSAHEEHHWDAERECIAVADGTATIAEVEAATGYALSVMHGFETGLACARLRVDELAQRLKGEPAVHEPPLVDMRVRSAFARQGLWVWDTNWRGDGVEVVLEDDLDRALHRVLAGLLGAALEAPAQTRWQISERDGDHLLDISMDAIDAARTQLPGGARHGPIDVNVLLPLAAASKTAAGESGADVALDVTRLALKHPLGVAQNEATAIVRQETVTVDRLVDALDVAARMLAATWDLIGTDGGQSAVLAHLEEAREAASAWRRGERARFIRLEYYLNRLYDSYHALPDRPLRAPVAARRA